MACDAFLIVEAGKVVGAKILNASDFGCGDARDRGRAVLVTENSEFDAVPILGTLWANVQPIVVVGIAVIVVAIPLNALEELFILFLSVGLGLLLIVIRIRIGILRFANVEVVFAGTVVLAGVLVSVVLVHVHVGRCSIIIHLVVIVGAQISITIARIEILLEVHARGTILTIDLRLLFFVGGVLLHVRLKRNEVLSVGVATAL